MSTELETLLEVQAFDTKLDQLRHRKDTLPERSTRDETLAALAAVDAELADADARRADLARDQQRIEDEISSLDAKRTAQNGRLYGGTVTNARELQDLQEEIDGLGRRIEHLEDQQLEVMELIEPIDEEISELRTARGRTAAETEAAETALTVAEAETDAEAADVTSERATVAALVSAELMAKYDALRTTRGGIAIARLVGNQCGGCHLTLSAVEVAALRKSPDTAGTCEECGRLLVP